MDNKLQNKENIPKDDSQFKRKIMTEDEELAKISIKSIEKDCLDRVFNYLGTMQNELSSDEDSKQKKYKKEIELKANEKKMKIETSNYASKISQSTGKKSKRFDEDEKQNFQKNIHEESTEKKCKIGAKAIRKVLRTLCDHYMKEEMDMMIWEVDENLDGYVSENEFHRMYKKCITDEKELQPKKLFYLAQFLMYDKEKKGYVIEEDTLEILYIRHGDNFNNAIDSIFNIEKKNEKTGKIEVNGKKERLTYLEYSERMHELSMRQRDKITNKKKIFCDKVKSEWKSGVTHAK